MDPPVPSSERGRFPFAGLRMITALRTHLGSWFAKILFGILVLSFFAFGIGDVIRWFGAETWIARVGGRQIELAELQIAYQNQMNQLTRMFGGRIEPTPEMKRGVAARALENLINETALEQEMARLHVLVPEAALGAEVAAMPEFRGPDGRFSRPTLQATLRNMGMGEQRFLELLRAGLGQRQLLGSIRAGAGVPDALALPVFQFQNERRAAEIVELPFAAAPAPEFDAAALQRFYDNNPDKYATPEYRRVKAVILAPQTMAGLIEITEEDLQAAYAARRAGYVTPEKRSAEIIVLQDESKAADLVALWRAGADWAAMERAATEAGGAPVALTDATRQEFPDPALADAVFAAAPGAVSDPVKTALGTQIVRVTAITPGVERRLADVREELRDLVLAEKASEIIHKNAQQVEDVLASGVGLDELPGDLGLAGVSGTMDAQGNTMDGEPAPIPGPADLRAALIAAAFQARPGDPPRLNEVRGQDSHTSSYYALVVEEITPPGKRPFAEIEEQVRADATRAAQRRAQEEAASRMLAAVQAGQSLEDAATLAGSSLTRTPLTGRSAPAEGVPAEIVAPLFGLAAGGATMVETPEAFLVVKLAEVAAADPAADAAGFARTRAALAEAIGNDTDAAFLAAVRQRARPIINQKSLDTFVQP